MISKKENWPLEISPRWIAPWKISPDLSTMDITMDDFTLENHSQEEADNNVGNSPIAPPSDYLPLRHGVDCCI